MCHAASPAAPAARYLGRWEGSSAACPARRPADGLPAPRRPISARLMRCAAVCSPVGHLDVELALDEGGQAHRSAHQKQHQRRSSPHKAGPPPGLWHALMAAPHGRQVWTAAAVRARGPSQPARPEQACDRLPRWYDRLATLQLLPPVTTPAVEMLDLELFREGECNLLVAPAWSAAPGPGCCRAWLIETAKAMHTPGTRVKLGAHRGTCTQLRPHCRACSWQRCGACSQGRQPGACARVAAQALCGRGPG